MPIPCDSLSLPFFLSCRISTIQATSKQHEHSPYKVLILPDHVQHFKLRSVTPKHNATCTMAAEPMACPDMPEEPAVTVLDADGDLLLKVGTTKCTAMPTFARGPHFHDVAFTFRVCSRTLARASPVWKRMLFGGFAESKPNEGDWIVGLPDDSPEAMSTLLGILYAKFDGVPLLNHLITTKDLFNITVLTDKYDLTHILRPWAKVWLDCLGTMPTTLSGATWSSYGSPGNWTIRRVSRQQQSFWHSI